MAASMLPYVSLPVGREGTIRTRSESNVIHFLDSDSRLLLIPPPSS